MIWLDGWMIKKRWQPRLFTFCWLVTVLLPAGCAGPLIPWQAETSLMSKAPSFAPSALRGSALRSRSLKEDHP